MPTTPPERIRPLGNRVAVKDIKTAPQRGDHAINGVIDECLDADTVTGEIVFVAIGMDLKEVGSIVYFSRFDAVPIATSGGVIHVVAVDKLIAKAV